MISLGQKQHGSFKVGLLLLIGLFITPSMLADFSTGAGCKKAKGLSLSATLQSINLLNGAYSAQYLVTLTNNSKHTVNDIRIKDTVTVSDNVVTALGATVSYDPNQIVAIGNVLELPTISSIPCKQKFSFTFILSATLNPGITANVTQNFALCYRVKDHTKRSCSTITNSTEELSCEWIPLQLSNTSPTTISKPGKYRVINSPSMPITKATVSAPNTCIIINSSDVTLDLCDHVLTGSGNLTQQYYVQNGTPTPNIPGGIQNDTRVDACIGILINPSGSVSNILTNITITNGKLQYYSLFAIQALFVNNITVTNLKIENSGTVTNPAQSGTLFDDCSGIICKNIECTSNRYSDIRIRNNNRTGENATVTNIFSKGLRGGTATSAFFNPAWLSDVNFVTYGALAIGGVNVRRDTATPPYGMENVVIQDCQITDVKSGGLVFGIFIQDKADGGIIKNCSITDIGQTLPDLTIYPINPPTIVGFAPDYEVRGIAIETFASSFSVEDCIVQNLSMVLKKVSVPEGLGAGNWCTGYNMERVPGRFVKNCVARDIVTAGKVTCSVPTFDGTLVSENAAAGFVSEIELFDNFTGAKSALNYQFVDCSAMNIDGGSTAPDGQPSPGYGFVVVNTKNTAGVSNYKTLAGLFSNCFTQDTIGEQNSAGFAIVYRNPDTANLAPFNPVVFENCVSQNDRLRIQVQPIPVFSNGFLTTARGNSVVFRGCTAVGHNLNGFDLAGYDALDAPAGEGNAKFILDDCISNANTGFGFRLDQSLNQVEVINCKASNNGSDGINVGGRNIAFRNTVSDLNAGQGFAFSQYYPFVVDVATNTDLSNLSIYSGNYTVQYVPGTVAAPGYFQYFNLIPNVAGTPLPASFIINGVTVGNGNIVLVKDETNPVLNGVYIISNNGGVVISGITTQVYQLIRLDPWRAPNPSNPIPAGTKVYVRPPVGPLVYTLNAPAVIVDTTSATFSLSPTISPDPSTIVVDSCKAAINGSNGLHNSAKDVTVRDSVADRNAGIGFLDDSISVSPIMSAQANGNLYTRNKAFNNHLGNYSFDYSGNAGVLISGSITGGFSTSVAPDGNSDITL